MLSRNLLNGRVMSVPLRIIMPYNAPANAPPKCAICPPEFSPDSPRKKMARVMIAIHFNEICPMKSSPTLYSGLRIAVAITIAMADADEPMSQPVCPSNTGSRL